MICTIRVGFINSSQLRRSRQLGSYFKNNGKIKNLVTGDFTKIQTNSDLTKVAILGDIDF
jgi:hypothetical protein